ncbi:TIR domain-containing protein [bacterium]|nr:TIR domain-containing protein [bacterium]
MAKKRIFISFDYDHDRNYRYLLTALAANPRSDIDFADCTPEEIQSYDISRIKAVLTGKIREATHVLVIIGKQANSDHPDRQEIGERNWQWWEIKKGISERKGFIAVKIERSNLTPEPLFGINTSWEMSYTVESILNAIDQA